VPDRDHLADGRKTLAAFLYPQARKSLRGDALPEWPANLVAQVNPALAEEIVTHFQAPENVVWCALRSRSDS
ncbi:MAG: hypothetical protein ABIQ18_40040, partial [Umezawaea sp.]